MTIIMMGLDQKSFANLKQLFLARMLFRETRPFFWFGEFRRCRRRFDEEHGCGTSATVFTVTDIDLAKQYYLGPD